ncbi:hypothetical protein D5S17_17615 [Pseudonocardiaceae bacterium YIM PH 21723]|nr:hypothetical protein D5S17_17615 [Pseudonocardiaceae bacterium YIM PH 21723]
MVIIGEVRTSLLHTSLPLPGAAAADLLALRPGTQVRATSRPINRTLSPDTVTGVDCSLPSEPRTRSRGIGTVVTRAIVVGGMVAQASSRAELEWTDYRERKPWKYYSRRPGVIEVSGPVTTDQVLAGFQMPSRQPETLDLGSISQRMINHVQDRPQLDNLTALRTRPTSMRWTAVGVEDAVPAVRLHIEDATMRTVRVTVPPHLLEEAVGFCEDLALHDWLYTTLGHVIAQAERDMARDADPMKGLRAGLSLLVRLWMPGAHVSPELRPLWQGLEAVPGFSEPWQRQVDWIRDQVFMRSLAAVEELHH